VFVYFLGVLVYIYPILGFAFYSYSFGSWVYYVLRGPILCPYPIYGFVDRYF